MWYKHTTKDCNLLELDEFIRAADERGEQVVTMAHYLGCASYNPNLSNETNVMRNIRFTIVFKHRTWKWW